MEGKHNHDYRKEFIDLLNNISDITFKRGDIVRANSFKKASDSLTLYNLPINNIEQLKTLIKNKELKYVGNSTYKILKEYVSSIEEGKESELIQSYLNDPILTFTNIYGVGNKKAQELIKMGFRTIQDLRNHVNQEMNKDGNKDGNKNGNEKSSILNDKQLIGLNYYEHINKRIPRNEILIYQQIFNELFDEVRNSEDGTNDIYGQSKLEIAGSFRRGLCNSGDIDIIMTNSNNDSELFEKFIDLCLKKNIIVELLSKGKSKSLTICDLSNYDFNLGNINLDNENTFEDNNKMCNIINTDFIPRRVDFLFCNYDEYPFTLLYFTGSKYFNTAFRQHCLDNGYTLNEHGLYHLDLNKKDKKGNKVKHNFEDEKSIFDFLNLEYKIPSMRIDVNSVVIKSNIQDDVQDNIQDNNGFVLIKKLNTKIVLQDNIKSKIDKTKSKIDKTKDKIVKESKMKIKIKDFVENFKIKGFNYLEELYNSNYSETIKQNYFENIYIKLNEAYYNDNPLISDSLFDIYKNFIEDKYPNSKVLQNVGCIPNKCKSKLPYFMPSMNKIKASIDNEEGIDETIDETVDEGKTKKKSNITLSNKDLDLWKSKYNGPYVISSKLDGVSALFTYNFKTKEEKLYTRGDLYIGSDITYLLQYINVDYLRKCLQNYGEKVILNKESVGNGDGDDEIDNDKLGLYKVGDLSTDVFGNENEYLIVLRGELIISKDNFDKHFKEDKANARNTVSGIVNSKNININDCKHVDFIVYEVINPSLKPSAQFELLNSIKSYCVSDDGDDGNGNGNYIVHNEILEYDDLTNKNLSSILVKLRKEDIYTIDGIIIAQDDIFKREPKNPKHAFAFKMVIDEDIMETTVVDVLWNVSKDGYLKPRIQVIPVVIEGSTITYITGNNGSYILDNKIGVGAIVKVIKSGSVIPKIQEVVVPAEEPKMPVDIDYVWNETHKEIMIADKSPGSQENKKESIVKTQQKLKRIITFFKQINVEGLGEGNITKIFNYNSDKDDKDDKATKGNKKIKKFNTIGKIIAMSKDDLLLIEGFKDKMATKIHNNIKKALSEISLAELMSASNLLGRGMGTIRIQNILDVYPNILNSELSNEQLIYNIETNVNGFSRKTASLFVENIHKFKKFIEESNIDINKFQNKKENDDDIAKQTGVVIANKVNKETFVVITKNIVTGPLSSKLIDAKDLNIDVITIDEFINKYNLV
jgi:NAD-dependent DNA ligase